MLLREIPPEGSEVLHSVRESELRIGRAVDAGIHLNDPQLSRNHLRLHRSEGRWMAEDQGSRNGTLLNGRPLLGPERLRPGDRLSLGRWVLVFESDGGDRAADPACEAETRAAEEAAAQPLARLELVGRSEAMAAVRAALVDFAPTELPVLLRGEPGTGKELAAALVHEQSGRHEGPFVIVNCPAVPQELFESELFGIAARTASGVDARPGRVLQACGGTLFLDEIGELAPAVQAKLLRFLESGTVDVVGAAAPVQADVRVVAATNRDLEAAVERGDFRQDLLDRLLGAEIRLPPLAERNEDVPLLAQHFAERARPRPAGLEDEVLGELRARRWPGNVRELKRCIETAAARARGATIGLEHLPPARGGEDRVGRLAQRLIAGEADFWRELREPYLDRSLSREETREVVRRVQEAFPNWKQAARAMGIEEQHKKLLQFLLDNELRPQDG